MCLFWELRAEGRGREKWRERRGRAGWRLYLLERTEAPTPTRPPTPSLSNIVPKLPSLCQRLHPQSPHLSRGRMLTAFWSSNCVRVTLLTSQLTCFCSAVGRSSGRMMQIRRRLLRTSPLTQWVKRGVWNGDEQTAAGSAQSWDHHLSVSWLLRMTSELHVVPTQNCASTQGAGEEKLGHHERVPPPLPRPSLLSLLLHLLLAPPLHCHKNRQTHTHSALSSYIPGALFFAGKHSSATGGEVELFEGSMESRLPDWLCLLCGHFAFAALAFSARHRGITAMQNLKICFHKAFSGHEIPSVSAHDVMDEWNKSNVLGLF